MNRRIKQFVSVIAVALLLSILPFVVSAQNELTLESLAEQFAGLVSRVTVVEERVQTLDQLEQRIAVLENPPETVTVHPVGESCDIVPGAGRQMGLRPPVVIKFVEQYLEEPDLVEVFGVAYYPESSLIEVKYLVYVSDFDHRIMVVEVWQGCENISLDFFFANYRGERIIGS